jgi:hypothetical protein
VTSDRNGALRFPGVPVGQYRVLVDSSSGGDSLVVVRVDTTDIDVHPSDTVTIEIGLSFPLLTVAQARTVSLGRKVFIEGVALTGPSAFADTTAHIVGGSGSLRLVRVLAGTFTAGDSVRVRGAASVRDGQRVLRDVTVFAIGVGNLGPPDSLSTGAAAGAAAGVLDAALVRAGGVLLDSLTVGQDLALDIDDGSGILRIILDDDITFQLGSYAVNGARVRATGVLVPSGAGMWYLKPRAAADLRVDVSVLLTTQVRQLATGQRVFVDGVALNRPNVFGDSTMHLADASGAIRVVEAVYTNVFPGDSVRVAGAVGLREGQVVVAAPIVWVRGTGGLIAARTLTTAEAATAGGAGAVLDAAYVRVIGTIQDTTRVAGDFRATVDDGSGPLTVVLDADVGFTAATTGAWAPAATAEVRGLLVPEGAGWVLKPRAAGDIVRP